MSASRMIFDEPHLLHFRFIVATSEKGLTPFWEQKVLRVVGSDASHCSQASCEHDRAGCCEGAKQAQNYFKKNKKTLALKTTSTRISIINSTACGIEVVLVTKKDRSARSIRL